MKYNKPLIAVLIGAVSTIPYEIFMLIIKFVGLTKHSIFEFSSMMFISKGSWWLGVLSAPATGGMAGLVLYELIRVIGYDYLPIKGALVWMTMWALIDIIFATLGKNTIMDQPLSGHFMHALGAGMAGSIMGYLMVKYLVRNSSNPHQL